MATQKPRGRRYTCVCPFCRIAVRRIVMDGSGPCARCGRQMMSIGSQELPKKKNDEAWSLLMRKYRFKYPQDENDKARSDARKKLMARVRRLGSAGGGAGGKCKAKGDSRWRLRSSRRPSLLLRLLRF